MIGGRKLETMLWWASHNGRRGSDRDEDLFAAALIRMGASQTGTLGREGEYYGTLGPPVPPREDGGALPGLGFASLPWVPGAKSIEEARYVAASRAWMHANCASNAEVRKIWLDVLECYRRGEWPEELR